MSHYIPARAQFVRGALKEIMRPFAGKDELWQTEFPFTTFLLGKSPG